MDGPIRILKTFAFALLIFGVGCSVPRFDGSTLQGRRAILDATHKALTTGDCASAIAAIEPLYASEFTNNEVRYARAAAQACAAGMPNFITTLMTLSGRSGDITNGGLWSVIAEMFFTDDSDVADVHITAAWNASDSLMAILKPGAVIAAANKINSDTTNPGSVIVTDRFVDANFYLAFVSMAQAGALQSRYGAPDSATEYERTKILGDQIGDNVGWTHVDNVDEAACSFASAVVTMIDTLKDAEDSIPDSMTASFGLIGDYGDLLDDACNYGCRGEVNPDSFDQQGVPANTDYSVTGCTFNTPGDEGCRGNGSNRPCLAALRNRTFCSTVDLTTTLDDRVRCAAAAIANFISRDAFGWAGSP